ncbi:hypothetical protein A3D88_01450 [Candidatus Peribacteria bacterium RIFCSPHIGHO2_02_FULL_52_16]|nr:MAG: hypothetical protein A2706_03690 [Candidatus Peribacteria bacterium RIFCSPHIGHO2_01_FULL_51_35]OGJ60985.1 MAG: hypothetical protein A3D88_01450 [Candidatus Peribacteria bacterium RIFCSPHIGHO2_02_FULL_52_16]
MSKKGFLALLIGSAVVLGVLMEVPQWLYSIHPLSQGVLVQLNSDEDLYLSRVMEALEGRPEQAAEAITGNPAVVPLQGAWVEEWEGRLFSWTSLSAAEVFQILDFIVPALLFLTLFWFLRLAGFDRWTAYAGAVLFSLLELYSLNRPVHQRESFLLMLLALACILEGLRSKRQFGVIGGVILGLLVGVYFWSWTFAWTFCALLLLWEGTMWALEKKYHPLRFFPRLLALFHRVVPPANNFLWMLCFLAVGVLAAIPAVLQLSAASMHPLAALARERMEFLPSHAPESWLRSGLFLLQLVGIAGATISAPHFRKHSKILIIFIASAFIVLNQQVFHGVTFLFSSHYLFSLVLAGVMTFLTSVIFWKESKWLLLSLVASMIFLGGIAYDGRHVLGHFVIDTERFSEQHFATLLPALEHLPRATILSDAASMQFVASHTRHDVPYSIRLHYMLISGEAFAERYCLAKLPLSPLEWRIEEEPMLIYDRGILRLDPSLREQELTLVEETCKRMTIDPYTFLKKYGVQYILWDTRRQPGWNVKRFKIRLQDQERGAEWIMYKIL